MPDVVQEELNKYGWPSIKIYYGEYKGENKFVNLTVKQAAAVADNIDAIYRFVDKHQNNKVWNPGK
ncbi:MAG: hypothetical protein WC332_02215 [Clostridia bacterium]|jgi:hypothetical protein